MAELRWVTTPTGSVALDDRTYPVVFATWIGASDAESIQAFFDWNDAVLRRVAADRRVFTLVTDATLASRPDPAARALIAERTARMTREHTTVEAFRVTGPIVIENPLVRGALTAIEWVLGTSMNAEYVDTCATAIASARRGFEKRGAPWPAGLTPDGYVPARR